MRNRRNDFFCNILRIALVVCLVLSFSLMSCSKKSGSKEESSNGLIAREEQDDGDEEDIEKLTDLENSDSDPLESLESENDEYQETLAISSRDILERKYMFSYPAIMGPPSQHNSIWTEKTIFVNSGKAGFTKIELNNMNMIENESYLINKEFIGSSTTYFLCQDKEAVYCLTKRNAKELWKKSLSSGGMDYYFPVNEKIIARMEFNQSKREGYVFVYNAETGKTLWERKLTNQNETFLGFSSSILLFTNSQNLIGIDPWSGQEVWSISSILKPGSDIYVSDYYRNFRILEDGSLLIPSSDDGEPLAYRIYPSTGKIIAEYRYDGVSEAHFQSLFFETADLIVISGRIDTNYIIVGFEKNTGKIVWETEINSVLGPFEKQYGVQCKYTKLDSKPNEILVEISDTTLLCLNENKGEILWSDNYEFSQIKTFWKDAYQIRVNDQDEKQINIEIVTLKNGFVIKNILLPFNYSLPTTPVSLLYSSDSHFLLRTKNNNQPEWLVYALIDNDTPEFLGLLKNNQESSTSLVFYVSNMQNEFLFIVSGEKGYELEIFTIQEKNVS